MEQKRNQYFDFLRGLAIIMVVGIHTYPGHDGFNSVRDELFVFVRQVINLPVPIFLAISGFFLSKKSLLTKADCYNFYKRQISRVYFPALIWGFPWLLLAIRYGNDGILLSVCLWLCCGLSVLYFIALVIQCYLLLPVIQKITPPRLNKSHTKYIGLVFAAVITILAVSVVVWGRSICGIHIPLIVFAGPFPLWIVFFVLGVYLANADRNYNIKYLLVLTILALVLQMIETHYLDKFHGVGDDIKISWVLYSFVVILLLFSKRLEIIYNRNFSVINTAVTYVGVWSFGIYLTHYLVRFVYYHLVPLRFWPLDWFLVIMLDLMFLYFVRRVLPKQSYKLLGI